MTNEEKNLNYPETENFSREDSSQSAPANRPSEKPIPVAGANGNDVQMNENTPNGHKRRRIRVAADGYGMPARSFQRQGWNAPGNNYRSEQNADSYEADRNFEQRGGDNFDSYYSRPIRQERPYRNNEEYDMHRERYDNALREQSGREPGMETAENAGETYQRNDYGNAGGGYNNYRRPRNNNPRGGYNNQRGGYDRPRNNYNQRGGYRNYDNQGGGYDSPRGGYRNYDNQGGGYDRPHNSYGNPRGGYRNYNNPGGYDNQRGGYDRPQRDYGDGGMRPRMNNRPMGYGERNYGAPQSRRPMNNRPYGDPRGNRYGKPNMKSPRQQNKVRRPIQPVKYQEVVTDPNEEIRLNKFLANAGICSRREADELITQGKITVNGNVVTELGARVTRQDEVIYNEKVVKIESKVYVLLNKPRNCVTTSDDPECRTTVMDIVRNACPERIYPVGRLDRNTTGVLLVTNDGDLAAKLTHPSFKKKKIYHVWLDKDIPADDMQRIAEGIELEDGEIHADAISYVKEDDFTQVGIEIHSGRNRIVRRIFEHLGYHVIKLDRVYFAGLTKKNLSRGKWRYLDEQEVNNLRMGSFD